MATISVNGRVYTSLYAAVKAAVKESESNEYFDNISIVGDYVLYDVAWHNLVMAGIVIAALKKDKRMVRRYNKFISPSFMPIDLTSEDYSTEFDIIELLMGKKQYKTVKFNYTMLTGLERRGLYVHKVEDTIIEDVFFDYNCGTGMLRLTERGIKELEEMVEDAYEDRDIFNVLFSPIGVYDVSPYAMTSGEGMVVGERLLGAWMNYAVESLVEHLYKHKQAKLTIA